MATRQVEIGCTYRYNATAPTAGVFLMEARQTERVQLSNVQITWDGEDKPGSGPIHQWTDALGNQRIRVMLPAGESMLRYTAVATVPDEIDRQAPMGVALAPAELPDDVLPFTWASRFCESDRLSDQAWRRFGNTNPGLERVMAIMDFVHSHLIYTSGSSGPSTTALDVYTSGRGVCRDFAQLMITLCRAMNLPARYAFGYFPDMDWPVDEAPMDFHAWVQVYIGDDWYDFDPRHNAFRKGRILVGIGHDASDTALVTTYGSARLVQMVVDAQEGGSERVRPYYYKSH